MFEQEKFTPELIVAGAKEFGSVDPREAAFNALAFTLDTESVALIFKVVDDKVHYAGAPSSMFASKGASESPVFEVLGSEDGAYIIDEIAYSILIIIEGERYETYSATFDQVRQTCAERSLEPKVMGEDAQAKLWETMSFEEAKQSHKVNRAVTTLGGIAAISCAILWIAMAMTEGALKQSAYNYDLSAQGEIAKVVRQIPTYQPIDVVISELSIAKTVAAKSGGWINRFEVYNNKTGLEILMPNWVTRDYIVPLGSVQAEANPKNRMIRVFRKLDRGDKE